MRIARLAAASALVALPLALVAGPAAATTDDGATVTGSVFLDLDGDGARDDGEPGRAGVAVTLRTSASILDATVTGVDGSWSFGAVADGVYDVVVDAPIDTVVSSVDEGTVQVDVAGGDVEVGPVGLASPVASGPDVALTAVHDAAASTPERLAWRIGVHNIGPDTAPGSVSVRVLLGDGHTAAGAEGDGWVCETGPSIATCTHPDDVGAASSLPTLTLLTDVTGPVGSVVDISGTVRLAQDFDAAPLNDEADASSGVDTELAADDTDGDGAADQPDTGSSAALLLAIALAVGAVGVVTLRSTRRP